MMKKILGVLSIVMLASTLLCGYWIQSTGQGDVAFHVQLGTATVIVCCITIILFLIKK